MNVRSSIAAEKRGPVDSRKPNVRELENRKTDKRKAILRAALKVFAQGGGNGTAIPAIAERARVGTGTIYRYFASKEALVNELYREQKEALGVRLTSNIDMSAEPHALFADNWDRLVAFAREEPEAYRFLEPYRLGPAL